MTLAFPSAFEIGPGCPFDGAGSSPSKASMPFVEGPLADPALEVEVRYHVVEGHVLGVTWGSPGTPQAERGSLRVARLDPLHRSAHGWT